MRRLLVALAVPAALLAAGTAAPAATPRPAPRAVVTFERDPLGDPTARLEGESAARFAWTGDAPRFAGDVPGSLAVHFRSDLPAARAGWRLPRPLGLDTPFVAAAIFEIAPDGFWADPDGYFQIDWGLWNASTTGLDRTGDWQDFSSDTFDSVEWDWYPNVSPWFGGPWLAPSVFGTADRGNPLFPYLGAFVNFSYGSSQSALPLGEPLAATIENNPADGLIVVTIARIAADGRLVPIDGGTSFAPHAMLGLRRAALDTLGIAAWHDGFAGPTPAIDATVHFHALALLPSRPLTAQDVARAR